MSNILGLGVAQQVKNTAVAAWYTTNANTLRYYKLDDLADSGPSGADLTDTGTLSTSFSGGYASFSGGSYLLDSAFSSIGTNFTIFWWKNMIQDVAAWQIGYSYGDNTSSTSNFNNVWSGSWATNFQWSGGEWNNKSTSAPIMSGEWIYTCVVKNGTTVSLYSGNTTTTPQLIHQNSGAVENLPTISKISIGGDFLYPTLRLSHGSFSGFIIENAVWNTTAIEAQGDKGAYYAY